LFAAVVVPLLAAGISEAWFRYSDQRARLDELLSAEARLAATKMETFIDGLADQLGWTVQLAWTPGSEERHRLDALRVMRQAPAIVGLTLVDSLGKERVHVSRIGLTRVGSGADRSHDPAVLGARAAKVWYGPVTYYRGSEPFMTLGVAGNRAAVGVAIAEVNLKLIWDTVAAIRIGKTGHAFVLDRQGRLVAHPDITMVLRGADDATVRPFQALRATIEASGRVASTGKDAAGRTVVAAMGTVPAVDWTVVVEQPLAEAFGPIYASLWRTGVLLLAGAALAGAIGFWLARRMVGPIRLLERGTEQIGAGNFNHRIDIRSGDELERLALRFNEMAGELALSQERSERISQLKRFLSPQIAELVGSPGREGMLDSQRRDVVVVFCDLRGFTSFSARVGPDEIMGLLDEYYQALGAIVTEYGATQTSFLGDGMMLLLNAPVSIPNPADRAVRMTIDMQRAVRDRILAWSARGYTIGFGMGIAQGQATVGRIGYEGRVDYTAIGTVVNLAARLCSAAEDGQTLIDQNIADQVRGTHATVAIGGVTLKGLDQVSVHELAVKSSCLGEWAPAASSTSAEMLPSK
jgi:class 3 adenylate cyclase